ncbi:phenylalanine--tRNA ligase subunit beta [Candidatus Latescibacterota bacterium]
MKLSLDWLGQYVDLKGLTPEEIAYKLTMMTAEVEGVETVTRSVEGVVVGEITQIEPVETGESDTLMNYVSVDLGKEKLESVCGAPNVKIGMKSAFAVPGTEIVNGLIVKERKVYGRVSRGILCSPRELGWGESHVGIMAFQGSLQVGTDLAGLVPVTDHVIDIDNKSITHRPDLWGHYGFARELAAIFKRQLKPLDIADSSEWENLAEFPLVIEDREGCPGYCCLDIDGLTPSFSSIGIQYRLLAVGLRPINLLVDLTNYIMCELGQPMHAFDGERVRDIIVAPFGAKGIFDTLDSIERAMIPEDLMIKDHTGSIAIAGIMGGEESEIKEDTSRVLLESANFNPASIRKTAVRLGLRTDASMRFEKGQPPYHMALSIKRFVQLMRNNGQNPIICSSLACGGDTGEKPRTMTVKTNYISKTIGMDIPEKKMEEILHSLGFVCKFDNDNLHLTIPTHRSVRDISIPNDIVEEVARIYGYNNIVPSMPEMELKKYILNTELKIHHKIRRFLSIAKGFNEVHTYSWYDNPWLKRIGYDPGDTLHIKNPATENNTRMRREILPNLFALIESNAIHRDRFFIYEIGNAFYPSSEGCTQIMNLAGIGYQSEKLGKLQDIFLSMKGTVEEIFVLADAGKPVFSLTPETSKPWQSTGSSMDITIGNAVVGKIGYLSGKMLDIYEKGTQVVWFELTVNKLTGHTFPEIRYDAIPVYPGSWMDFSILADKTSCYADLADLFDRFSHPILKKRKFLYSYEGKGLPGEKVSYTFRFWLGLKERTLTSEDLSSFRTAFLTYLEQHGLSLR